MLRSDLNLSERSTSELVESLPLHTAFVSKKALEGLPNAAILTEIGTILGSFSTKLKAIADQPRKGTDKSGQLCWGNQIRVGQETQGYRRSI